MTVMLSFAAFLLASLSAGLLFVRITNPRLKGLSWLAAGFLTGCLSALLILYKDRIPDVFALLVSDLTIFGTIVLMDAAFLELSPYPSLVPNLGSWLLCGLTVEGLYRIFFIHDDRYQVAVLSLVVIIQVCETVRRLLMTNDRALRAPAWMTSAMLIMFILFNVVRGGLDATGRLYTSAHYPAFATFTYAVYVAVAMGVGFGFFWMTTAGLTAGFELMATTDPLTRLYNRRVFLQWCEKELQRSGGSTIPFSILMIDLDYFKQINDRFGHLAGDAVLCSVVEKIQDSVRGIDVLCRWGGEEFTALLPGADPEAALLVADRIRSNVERTRMTGPLWRDVNTGDLPQITASLGIGTLAGPNDTVAQMLARADRALYESKAAGRNCVSTSS